MGACISVASTGNKNRHNTTARSSRRGSHEVWEREAAQIFELTSYSTHPPPSELRSVLNNEDRHTAAASKPLNGGGGGVISVNDSDDDDSLTSVSSCSTSGLGDEQMQSTPACAFVEIPTTIVPGFLHRVLWELCRDLCFRRHLTYRQVHLHVWNFHSTESHHRGSAASSALLPTTSPKKSPRIPTSSSSSSSATTTTTTIPALLQIRFCSKISLEDQQSISSFVSNQLQQRYANSKQWRSFSFGQFEERESRPNRNFSQEVKCAMRQLEKILNCWIYLDDVVGRVHVYVSAADVLDKTCHRVAKTLEYIYLTRHEERVGVSNDTFEILKSPVSLDDGKTRSAAVPSWRVWFGVIRENVLDMFSNKTHINKDELAATSQSSSTSSIQSASGLSTSVKTKIVTTGPIAASPLAGRENDVDISDIDDDDGSKHWRSIGTWLVIRLDTTRKDVVIYSNNLLCISFAKQQVCLLFDELKHMDQNDEPQDDIEVDYYSPVITSPRVRAQMLALSQQYK